MHKEYTLGLNMTETAGNDPYPTIYEDYVCGAQRNYTDCCTAEVDKMIDAISEESDVEKRKHRVRAIHENFAEDDARPIIFSNRAAT